MEKGTRASVPASELITQDWHALVSSTAKRACGFNGPVRKPSIQVDLKVFRIRTSDMLSDRYKEKAMPG